MPETPNKEFSRSQEFQRWSKSPLWKRKCPEMEARSYGDTDHPVGGRYQNSQCLKKRGQVSLVKQGE